MRGILLTSVLALSLGGVSMLSAQGSDTVRATQQALKDKGFDPGPIDGVNGPRTESALKDYQKQQNLTPDGVAGPKTLASLGVNEGAGAGGEMDQAGSTLKHSYAKGGKDMGHGGKEMGTDVKDGHPVDAAKDLGKGVGHGAEKIGVGTGHAAKDAAKGVKDAVTGKPKQ